MPFWLAEDARDEVCEAGQPSADTFSPPPPPALLLLLASIATMASEFVNTPSSSDPSQLHFC
jgi:hypothetical protein